MSNIEYRTKKLEDKLDFLYCYVKNHQGGGTETDPIFTASPSFSITQQDIDKWNTGGSSGNYVPLDGMNLLAGEKMKPDFLLANYNILTEVPPANSIAVGMSQDLGGFVYQGSSVNGGLNYNGSLNASPNTINGTSQLTGTNGNFFSNYTVNASNVNINTNGTASDGNYSGNISIATSVNPSNKATSLQLNVNGYDNLDGSNFYYGLTLDQFGIKLDGLPNAQGDINFTKNIVAKNDGTFGWEDISPKLENLPNSPLGGSVSGVGDAYLSKKGDVITVRIVDFYVPKTTSKNQSTWYIGELSSVVNMPQGIMFPVLFRLSDGVGGNLIHVSCGYIDGRNLFIIIPSSIQNDTTRDAYITAQFQIVNTNS